MRFSSRGSRISSNISIARDITDLEAERQKALAASTAKTEFLSSMSHEIRTPMNAILGMADLMGESDLDAEQRELCPVDRRPFERHPGQPQKAGRIAGGEKSLYERRLDQIEIGLGAWTPLPAGGGLVAMRRPARRSASHSRDTWRR